MNKRKFSIVAITFLLGFFTISMGTSPTKFEKTQSSFKPFTLSQTNSVALKDNTKLNKAIKETPITDEYAVKYISKTLDKYHASRALIRVKNPMPTPEKLKDIKFVGTSTGNWGGYIAKSTGIKGSNGDFNVPADSTGYIAPWTGVGGVGGGNLAQTGILSGESTHLAWIELYPAAPQYMFSVNVGDSMCSSVSYDGDSGLWNFLIQDLTTTQYYQGEYNFIPDTTSAEWVVEPYGTNSIGSFSIDFNTCFWDDSSSAVNNINSIPNGMVVATVRDSKGAQSTPTGIVGGRGFSISH